MKRFLFILATSVLFSCGNETEVDYSGSPCAKPTPTPIVTATPVPDVTATPVPDVTATPIPEAVKAPEPTQNYGTFTPGRDTVRSWSMFTTIEKNGCQLPMILWAANGARVNREEALFTRKAFEKAASTWSLALNDNPSWPCKGGVRTTWLQSPGAPGTISVFIDQAVQRSHSIVGGYEIRLSPQYKNPSDPYAERVILHEMGHQAGLSDTYTERGYQQPIGQPEGIMNNLYRVSSLTPDDIAGANALYDYMNGRGEFCDDGYKTGGAYENKNRVAFCVPT